MRILHVNKFLRQVGGAETYTEGLSLRQSEAGHDVALFGGRADRAFAPGVPRWTTRTREYEPTAGLGENLRTAVRTVWSREAEKDFRHILDVFEPDVVHLHNYAHQLTSSVVQACRGLGVPAVHTAHDYKLVCPAFVAVRRGHDCFDCAGSLSPHALRDACVHGSRARTSVAVAEAVTVRRMSLSPEHIIAPSAYMHRVLERSWVAAFSQVHLVRHPLESRTERWRGGGGYLLYAGRLGPEKGVEELERACTALGVPLLVAGRGPVEEPLRELIAGGRSTATLLGHLGQDELDRYRLECIAQVVPSAWPEVAGLVALEAAALGVPLLLSDRGGLPEVLELGGRGMALDLRNSADFEKALQVCRGMRPEHPVRLPETLGWRRHLLDIEDIYGFAIRDRRR